MPTVWSARGAVCVVLVCDDTDEAEKIGRTLLKMNNGILVAFQRVEHMVLNAPAGKVAVAILFTQDPPALIGRALKWLRNHWPHCHVTVVGDVGGGPYEMAADGRRHPDPAGDRGTMVRCAHACRGWTAAAEASRDESLKGIAHPTRLDK